MSNMHTWIVELSDEAKKLPQRILEPRLQSNVEWINAHGSGTLMDNKELGFVTSIQCTSERVAYTFGYGFGAYRSKSVMFNDAITECDEAAYTIAGRWAKRYMAKNLFPEDTYKVKYVSLRDDKGKQIWEGIALILCTTSATFIPKKSMILAKIVEYDSIKHCWKKPINFA